MYIYMAKQGSKSSLNKLDNKNMYIYISEAKQTSIPSKTKKAIIQNDKNQTPNT